MSVQQTTLLELKARQAALAWSDQLWIEVTPDLIALGALLVTPTRQHATVERLVEHLRDGDWLDLLAS